MVQRMAYMAAASMIVLFATTFILRKKQYELFHLVHFTLAVMIITGAALHRPKVSTRSVIILITAGSIWGGDRVLRFFKTAFAAIGNSATVSLPLSLRYMLVLNENQIFFLPFRRILNTDMSSDYTSPS